MRTTRQKGFSLLELLVAMTILAVLASIGFVTYKKQTAQARHIKARTTLEIVGGGLDRYYLKHGTYPDLSSFEAMVEPNSPLVKQDFIPANTPTKDPWGQPYEGTSFKGNYHLESAGDPGHPDEFGKITIEPGKFSDSPSAAAPAQTAPTQTAPAGGTGK